MKFISGIFGGNKENGNFFLELKDEPDEPMPKANSKTTEVSQNGKKPPTSSDTVKAKDAEAPSQIETKPSVKPKAAPVEKKTAEKAQPAPVENKTATVKVEEKQENVFAPKYLMPKNNNMRRRPGANMNSFLDMASKVKTGKK